MGQSNVNCKASNKMKHEGLDGAIVSAVKIAKEALYKVAITQENASEVHHMEIVHPVLTTLKERLIGIIARVTLDLYQVCHQRDHMTADTQSSSRSCGTGGSARADTRKKWGIGIQCRKVTVEEVLAPREEPAIHHGVGSNTFTGVFPV